MTGAYFLQNQQVLVASNQIVGFCFYGQCKQIVISFVSTNRNLLLGFKYLSNELHKLYKRLHILLREILREFGTRRNIANLFKEFITKNQLNTFITQQVNEIGKPSSNKKADPAIGVCKNDFPVLCTFTLFNADFCTFLQSLRSEQEMNLVYSLVMLIVISNLL